MILPKDSVPAQTGKSSYPDPFNLGEGHIIYRAMGDAGGLTQFGAYLQSLQPGRQSSQMHWHSHEDEFMLMISGALTVVENGVETVVAAGDACCWKAGDTTAHTLRNHTDAPASYLIVGTRSTQDICHYPGLDMLATQQGFTHLDGTPYPKKGDDT